MNPGTYQATLKLPRIADQLFTTSTKGTDGINMVFDVDGTEVSTVLWLSPAAYARTLEVLKDVFGFDGDFNKLAKTLSLPNLECQIVVEDEEYIAKDGTPKTRSRIKWINSRKAAQAPKDGVRGVLSRIAAMNKPTPTPSLKFGPISHEKDDDGIPY